MIRLQPEQVWMCNVTRQHRPLFCPSYHSWCFCLEEWCESAVLCGLFECFGNCDMEWTDGSVIEFIETQRQCQPFLNRNGFHECCVLFRDFFSILIKNSNSLGDILVKFLYNPLTDWKFNSASKPEPLYTSLLVYSCLWRHRRSFLFFFKAQCIQKYEAAASCKDIARAPVTNGNPTA